MKKVLLFSLGLTLAIACGNSKKMSKKNLATIIQPVILTNDFTSYSRESVETEIMNAVIIDSTLTINVSYNGGCKDHSFQLLGSLMIQKSMPAIRNIMLVHNGNGDDCREKVEQELKFNISKFKYPNGDIMLNLQNYSPKLLFKSID